LGISFLFGIIICLLWKNIKKGTHIGLNPLNNNIMESEVQKEATQTK
jgi:hypothetical protein